MAQLGDLDRAKALVRSAACAFGPKEAVARARCVVAEAEIALVSRDLGWPAKALPDEDGARCARAGRACHAPRPYPCADGGGRKRIPVVNTRAAPLMARGEERLLLLEEVEAVLASRALVVDACRQAEYPVWAGRSLALNVLQRRRAVGGPGQRMTALGITGPTGRWPTWVVTGHRLGRRYYSSSTFSGS